MKRAEAFSIFALLLAAFIVAGCSSSHYAPEESSPFTAVEWEKEIPKVQFNNRWMYFEGVDHLALDIIVAYCKKEYGEIWKKRFAEDFVEVLKGMGHSPGTTVQLQLRSEGPTQEFVGTMSEENRKSVVRHNNKLALLDPTARERLKETYRRVALHPRIKEAWITATRESGDTTLARLYEELFAEIEEEFQKPIDRAKALEDIQFLVQSIRDHYSYASLKGVDYDKEFKQLTEQIPDEITITTLALEVQKKLALFGDGHTRVSGRSSLLGNGYLPFAVALYQDEVLCIHPDGNKLLEEDYPFLKSVNGVSVERLLDETRKIVAAGSEQFVKRSSVARLSFIRYLLSELQVSSDNGLKVVLKNETGQTHQVNLPLSETRHRKRRESEDQLLDGNIGYLRIPSMSSDEKRLDELKERMKEFQNTDGIIIDIRDNPGGSRAITKLLSPYFLPNNHAPIVANAAVFRTDDEPHAAEGYLENRSLYPITSSELDDKDRAAIKEFTSYFKPEPEFPAAQFSQWHYFLLRPDNGLPYYSKPVVVLINPGCFSAADIFAAAFKELPNVILVGKTTGGGSGRSRRYRLPNSKVEVRLSSMASFQPNGKLFEGNGVEPDVVVEESISDILGTTDSQLSKAMEVLISSKNGAKD